jgi:NADP-dependent 3-hydroxy acid dehydrogenase YdfG
MSKLKDKVFFVTGASSGIGEAVAREAAEQGANVVLAARRADKLERVVADIKDHGGSATYAVCDVTEPEQLASAVAKAREVYGGLDVVMANAGFGVQGNLTSLSVDDYRRQFDCNVFGVLNTLYATLESLRERRGCIGVVGSANGYLNVPGWSAYCMSKHAVRSLCACIRHELLPEGVSVTHLAPGFIESDFRKTSNDNVLKADAQDPVPSWLVMPARKAAKKMIAATVGRRGESVITVHAKAVVGLERHASSLVSGVIGLSGAWVKRLSKDAG